MQALVVGAVDEHATLTHETSARPTLRESCRRTDGRGKFGRMESSALVSTDAMILAAGLGTRMRSLTQVLPKPLAPIGDRAALAHIVDELRAAGFAHIAVNAHHLAAHVEAFASADGRMSVSVERELLGTAGGVRRAVDAGWVREKRLLVVNGDLFASLPIKALARHQCRGDAVLLAAPAPTGLGNVGVDETGRVVRLRNETIALGEAASFAYLGCALLGESLLGVLPAEGCLVGDVLLPRLRSGSLVEVMPFLGAWLDVGTLRSYLEANVAWLNARGLSSHVADGVTLEHVQLTSTVIGVSARIAAHATLDRCVVWPHASVPAGTHRDRVFVPGVAPIDVAEAAR